MSGRKKLEEAKESSPDIPPYWSELDQVTLHERVLSDMSNNINQPVCHLVLSLAMMRNGEEYHGPWLSALSSGLRLEFGTFNASAFTYQEGTTDLRDKTALTLWTADFEVDSQGFLILKPFAIWGHHSYTKTLLPILIFPQTIFSGDGCNEVLRFNDGTAVKVIKRTYRELPEGWLVVQRCTSLHNSENPVITTRDRHNKSGPRASELEETSVIPYRHLKGDPSGVPYGPLRKDELAKATSVKKRDTFEQANSPQMVGSYHEHSWISKQSPSSFQTALSSIESLSAYSTPLSRPGSLGTTLPGQILQRSRFQYQVGRVSPPLSDSSAKDTHSDYVKILKQMNLLSGPTEELNWSGKGQHVEFSTMEEIPLTPLVAVGHGGSALVDSVLCRRIKLARKTMTLSRRQRLETVIAEVEHLQRLRHPHIVQLVGSYIQGRSFSILLYPVAEFNLSLLLERMTSSVGSRSAAIPRLSDLAKFQRCLSHALEFVHRNTTKHMDIKPQNILARRMKSSWKWRVYLADFGISKHFTTEEMSKTDHLTPRSKIYCSPEVYEGERKGRSSDVFSMGCVFLEIETVLASKTIEDFVEFRSKSRDIDDPLAETFHNNSERVREWIKFLEDSQRKKGQKDFLAVDLERISALKTISFMLAGNQEERPAMSEVRRLLGGPRKCCLGEREKYEVAEMKNGRCV